MNGKPITPEIEKQIISLHQRNKISQRKIAEMLGISQMSVCLALKKKEKKDQKFFCVVKYYRTETSTI